MVTAATLLGEYCRQGRPLLYREREKYGGFVLDVLAQAATAGREAHRSSRPSTVAHHVSARLVSPQGWG